MEAEEMGGLSMLRAVLSGVVGIVIGVIFTAVLNLVSPADNLVRTLIVVCFAALVSAFLGYVLGARQKK
jgi:chromate transport protein ChrA